jgi:hypothetical protein
MRVSHVPISFQTLQVVSDLRSVADKGFTALATQLKPDLKAPLHRVIFDQKARMRRIDAEMLHEDLLLVAALPDKGFDAFLAATALLLADRLQEGAGSNDLAWNWSKFQESFRAASAPTRAALMNGFRLAHATRRVALEHPPCTKDFFTYDLADTLRLLKEIARAMPEETRDAICDLADGDTCAVHRTALENLLNGSCVLSEFGGWFPGEVIEAAARDCDHPGHAGAMALVLIDAIETRDARGRMAHCWEHQAEDFNLLTPEQRGPMIAGVRHLHEMGFDWKPYAAWPAAELVEKAIVVPFARA